MSRCLPVFIGLDRRTEEAEAAAICASSMHRRTTVPLHIQWIHEPALRNVGLYWRKWRSQGGQMIDVSDGKPFSTDFAFTRFLVPALMQHRGVALFCDGDFLFLSNPAALLDLFDPNYAVQVVKHTFAPPEGTKMDGVAQQAYWRKNWSSLILWNCSHPSNQRLTPHKVNTEPGQWLHGFGWLDDDEIGALPPDWNWLAGVDPERPGVLPSAVHYTLGVPSMPGHEAAPHADLWRWERDTPAV